MRHPLSSRGACRLGVAASAAVLVGLGSAGMASPANAATSPTAPSAVVANDTLTITGTRGNDAMILADAGDQRTLLIDFGLDNTIDATLDRTTFDTVDVLLSDGHDQFTALVGALTGEIVTVNAGNGDDVVQSADSTDLILGANGNDTINSGAGDDMIFTGGDNDNVLGGVGRDTAFLGTGNDVFTWNPGEGSDIVDGSFGADRLDFFGAGANEKMSVAADGSTAVFLRDLGNIRMDMINVDELSVKALGGTDEMTVNDLRGTGTSVVDVDLAAPGGVGDAAIDLVTVNASARSELARVDAVGDDVHVSGFKPITRIRNAEPTDHLQVNALDGNDIVQVDPAAAALIDVDVDLGLGQRTPRT